MKTANEFEIDFSYSDLFEYGAHLAAKLNVSFDNNEVIFPENIAQGYFKFFKLNDYMSYLVGHYVPEQQMVFNRLPTKESHISIAFRNFSFQKIDNPFSESRVIELNKNSLGSIYCKNTQMPEMLVMEPGLEIKVIVVLLKEGWLQNVLRDSQSKEKISQYIISENASLNLRKEFLSPEQNKLFAKIFAGNNCFLMENLFYDGRILNLLESFFKDLLNKEDTGCPYLFPSYDDIHSLQEAEKYIIENLMNPFPGVEVLSRICCMSRTKFINLFQKVYGVSSFEFSQKKRLSKAFDYLKTGRYSVSDTSQMIGYTGVNNFAIAFRKEFGMSPGELLENLRVEERA